MPRGNISPTIRQVAYDLALFLLLSCSVVATYLPGLEGGFFFDDYTNLLESRAFNHHEGPRLDQIIAEGRSGPGGRPLSLISFYLDYQRAGGFDPRAFKTTGLLLHLLNGALVWALVTRLLGLVPSLTAVSTPRRIGLLVAGAWLLHPLHVSTVMYVVQRMSQLSALFLLAGLLAYIEARRRQHDTGGQAAGLLTLSAACLPLAFLSKENGALLAPLALALELLLLRQVLATPRPRSLQVYYFCLLVLPLLALLTLYLLRGYNPFAGFEAREFTLQERLLTQARVLWSYAYWILVPDISNYGLFHDDYRVSTGWLSPPGTLAAIAGLSVVIAFCWVARRRYPVLVAGIGLFLVGHSLEAGPFPLLMVFEHRNYLPSLGLLLTAAAAVQVRIRPGPLRWTLALALLLALALVTLVRVQAWGNPLAHALTEVAYHPESSMAHYRLGVVRLTVAETVDLSPSERHQWARLGIENLEQAARLEVDDVSIRIALLRARSAFVGPIEEKEIGELASRLATARPDSNSARFLLGLASCQRKAICQLTDRQFNRLLDAASLNPTLKGYAERIRAEWSRMPQQPQPLSR